MSHILLLLALLVLFLAVGVSRSVFDGKNNVGDKKVPIDRTKAKKRLWISWILAGIGGILVLLSYWLDR